MRALLLVLLLAACTIADDVLPSQRASGDGDDGFAYDAWQMEGQRIAGPVDDDLDLPDGVVD